MDATTAPFTPARERCLPVDEALIPLLPAGGLPRGRVVGCTGPAALSLALGLASRAVTAGSWLAVVGLPALGVETAIELGVPASRLVLVDVDGGPAVWAERVAAAADGFEVVITHAPAGADRLVARVRHRLHARGTALLVVAPTKLVVSCDLELASISSTWEGLGQGHGCLIRRRVVVRAGGRRMPRPIEHELWLPGSSGGVELVQPIRPSVAVEPDAVLSRAG